MGTFDYFSDKIGCSLGSCQTYQIFPEVVWLKRLGWDMQRKTFTKCQNYPWIFKGPFSKATPSKHLDIRIHTGTRINMNPCSTKCDYLSKLERNGMYYYKLFKKMTIYHNKEGVKGKTKYKRFNFYTICKFLINSFNTVIIHCTFELYIDRQNCRWPWYIKSS